MLMTCTALVWCTSSSWVQLASAQFIRLSYARIDILLGCFRMLAMAFGIGWLFTGIMGISI